MKKNTLTLVTDTLKHAYALDKAAVFLTIFLALLLAVKPYVGILLSAWVVDSLATGSTIQTLVVTVLAGVVAIFLMSLLEGIVKRENDVHIDICVRRFDMEVSKKTLTMDYEQLDSPLVNDLRKRISSDNIWSAGFYSVFHQLGWMLNSAFGLIVSAAILIPLFQACRLFSSWASLVFLILLLAVTAFSSVFNAKYTNRKSFYLMDQSGKMIRSVFWHHILGGVDYKSGKDYRIYNASELLRKHCAEDDYYHTWVKSFTKITSLGGLVTGLASGIVQGGAYLFVVLQAVTGKLTVGSVVKYAAAIYNFANSLTEFINAYGYMATTAKRQQSILDYIRVPEVLYKGTLPVEKRDDNEYEIEFHNVSFKYPGSNFCALKNLSLKLTNGQRLAVVGMNGSGKTTMIKLLCRLYDPTEGVITLNGIDIRKYDHREYMGIFSVVFQDFKLFSLPLAQNITANLTYDVGRISQSLKKAGFGGRIQAMSQGINTPLYKDYDDHGIEISSGEAQKLALARALYKDAPFVVLDEPTASLDPIAEFEVYSKFYEIIGSKTTIFISHRLSSCRFCDNIAVFHEGKIIQRGNHEALLKDTGGKYYELWNAQAKYYNAGEYSSLLQSIEY